MATAEHIHNEEIPIDQDGDSTFGDGSDLESATTSLRTSAFAYRFEHGRRFHAYRAGQYWGPNDEQAADQLDIGHHMYTVLLGDKLFLAPLPDKPQRALDVGTGTGIWAMDFADKYPDCQVIGTDLSPTQPRDVPPNLQFEIDDACSDWVFTKESFDYIHVRGMYGSVADWPKFYGEVMKHLKPGGYLEQLEISVDPTSDDGSVDEDSMFSKWGKISLEAGDAWGRSLRILHEMKGHMVDAGFEGVVEHQFKLPIGGWPKDPRLKEVGMFNRLHWEQGMEGWCLYLLTKYCGWSYEEVMVYIANMRKALRNKKYHAYHECKLVYGRKPLRSVS